MNWEIDISESLRFRYVTANTPSYLFKYFAADSLVKELSDKRTLPELENRLEAILGNASSTDDAVRAYVLAVAIALKGYGQHSYPLPWWNQIVELARAARHAFSISYADFDLSPTSTDIGSLLESDGSLSTPSAKNSLGKWNISLTKG